MELRTRKEAATQAVENHTDSEDDATQKPGRIGGKRKAATKSKPKAEKAAATNKAAAKSTPQAEKAAAKSTPQAKKDSSLQPVEPAEPMKPLKRVRGKRGSLQYMLEVPLDILLEIFAHLQPNDLLNLARTNKDFRAFLMKKSSLPFWKTSRKNVEELPPCPDDMTEPAYANLLFQSHCHGCQKKNCYTVYWRFRARLCKQCYHTSTDYLHYCGTLASLFTVDDISALLPMLRAHSASETIAMTHHRFYLPQVEEFRAFVRSHKDEPNAISAYIEELKARLATIEQSTDELDRWFVQTRENRTDELDELRQRRREQIIDQLKTMGWEEEFRCLGSRDQQVFRRLPEVRKPQLLTSRIWKNIEAPVIKFMEEVKAVRLVALKKDVRVQRMKLVASIVQETFSPEILHAPSAIEVVMNIPRVRETIDGAPYEDKMDASSFDWLPDTLIEYADRRFHEAKAYFEDTIRSELQLDSSIEEPLSLAVAAWFACESCKATHTFPAIINHYCWERERKTPQGQDEFNILARNSLSGPVWKAQGHKAAIGPLYRIVQAYGLDPKIATTEDMDQSRVRLVCSKMSCYHRFPNHSNKEVRQIMDWRAAYSTGCYDRCGLIQAPEAVCVAVKPLEQASRTAALKGWELDSDGFGCRHCRLVDHKSRVLLHIRDEHHITDPSETDWYDAHKRPMFPNSVFLVSETVPREKIALSLSNRMGQFGTVAYFTFDDMEESAGAAEPDSAT